MKFIVIISCNSIVFDSKGDLVPEGALKSRLDTGIELWRQLITEESDIFLLVSGGHGDGSYPISASLIMKKYCISNGIPCERILEDPNALSTIENAINTCKLLHACEQNGGLMRIKDDNWYDQGYQQTHRAFGPVTNLWIVTSQFHIERTKIIYDHFLKLSFGNRPLKIDYTSSPNNISDEELIRRLSNEKRSMATLKSLKN